MVDSRKKILVCIDWFEPGFKAGGPIRSAVNFVSHLKADFDIYVFTTDRDLGDEQPYPGIPADQWIHENGFHVFYASQKFLGWSNIKKLVGEIKPEYLYLNSMFSRFFSIYPLLMLRGGKLGSKLVLAPRGMLRGSALQHKSKKKELFLSLAKFTGLFKGVRFQATDFQEMQDVKKHFGQDADCLLAGNLPGSQGAYVSPPEKKRHSISIIFVGRVHPIKNLAYLLECIKEVDCEVNLNVIAPIEDLDYWNKCEEIIRNFPETVNVTHLQDVSHDKIRPIMLNNHIFALPTAGENFGHAIFESFAAGRPVLISDQTPWQNLEHNLAGWDIPLTDKDHFVKTIEKVAAMDSEQLDQWCRGAWNYCRSYIDKKELKEDYYKLFS